MTLDQLIARLERAPQNAVPPVGFGKPHCYRGYYDNLAFEPVKYVSFGEMLALAKGVKDLCKRGGTFTAYKGGEFSYNGFTTVWLANWGDTGEGIGPVLLDYMERTAEIRWPEKWTKDSAEMYMETQELEIDDGPKETTVSGKPKLLYRIKDGLEYWELRHRSAFPKGIKFADSFGPSLYFDVAEWRPGITSDEFNPKNLALLPNTPMNPDGYPVEEMGG